MKLTRILSALALLWPGFLSAGPAPWGTPAMQPGIAGITCISPWTPANPNGHPNADVFAMLDVREACLNGLPLPNTWNLPANKMFHHPMWNLGRMGEVFGVDVGVGTSSDIYVTALGVKPTFFFTPRDWQTANNNTGTGGEVFCIPNATCIPAVIATLPNHRAQLSYAGNANQLNFGMNGGTFVGLGQVSCTGAPLDLLYVSNLDDGRIYIMTKTGTQLGTWDHGLNVASLADDPSQLYTQQHRMVYGLEYHPWEHRLYYAMQATNGDNNIWSVGLTPAGLVISGSQQLELAKPGNFQSTTLPGYPATAAVDFPSDIQFSQDGCDILVAQETIWFILHTASSPVPAAGINTGFNAQVVPLKGAHGSAAWTATFSGGNWSITGTYKAGIPFNNKNCITGDFGFGSRKAPLEDDSVVLMCDQITGGFGLQISPIGDFLRTPGLTFDVPLSGNVKTSLNDVDILRTPPCMKVEVLNPLCPTTPGGPYTGSLKITNLMPATTIAQLQFLPCPTADLPAGASAVSPAPSPITLTNPIPPGGMGTVPITFPNVPPIGGKVCFLVQVISGPPPAQVICSRKVCVTLPPCPCMNVASSNLLCPVYEGDEHKATLTITNLWNTTAYQWRTLPCPQNDLPAGAVTVQPNPAGLQTFSPPLAPSATSGPLPISFPGLPSQNTPLTVCFIVQFFSQNEGEGPWCEKKVCITFPPCPPPLPCVTATFANVLCPTDGSDNYTMNITITNGHSAPAWTALLTPCGGAGGPPANPMPPIINLPPLNQNQSGAYPITVGGVGLGGGLACFCLTLLDNAGATICTKVVCVTLPPCPCATFAVSNIQCPQYEGQPHTAVITVTNTGSQPLHWLSFTPCQPLALPANALPGVSVGPAGLLPLGPLLPNASANIPITLTGIPKAGGLVCFNIAVFGMDEMHPACEEKFCFPVPPCPPCLPCMNLTATPAQCPTVQSGPFTTTITITNLQPVPAVTAQLIPCLPGLNTGEVAATPIPAILSLPLLNQNQSGNYNISLTGVTSGQLACFCVRLFDAAGNLLCEKPVCLVMPQCPPLCATVTPMDISCPNPAIGPSYSATLQVLNQSATTYHFYQTCPVPSGSLPAGAITGQPQPSTLAPFSPPIASAGTGTASVTLPPNLPPTGSTFCFIIKFFGQFDNLICQKMVCLTLPPCQCGVVLSHSVDCVPTPGGVKRQLTVTVQNLTNVFGTPFDFNLATLLPGAGFAPASITPSPNPIPPGGTGTLTTCYNGTTPPQCLQILLTNTERTRCCVLKLCPLWIECAPPETDHCRLAPCFVSENGAPAPVSAWISNGSATPKTYQWTVTPAFVAGCTGTLPAIAFSPAGGTVTAGGFSSAGVSFTASAASLLPGQCAGFQICFQEVHPLPQPLICCTAKIRRSRDIDICVDWNHADHSIPIGAGQRTIVIKNPTSDVLPLDLLLVQSGGTEFSLTGEFPAAGGSGLPGPPADYDTLPISLVLGPYESAPVTFTARVNPYPFTGTGPTTPAWGHWQLLRLCNLIPIGGGGGGGMDDDPVLATTLMHLPPRRPGVPIYPPPYDFIREFRWEQFGQPGPGGMLHDSFVVGTGPGEILRLLSSSDLETFLPAWPVPFATVQGPDGAVAGTGDPLTLNKSRSADKNRCLWKVEVGEK